MTNATIRHNGARVQLIIDGRLVADLSWEQAHELAAGLRTQALRAEEWAKAERIASDQAILLRAGVPLGLTDHPIIQAEAAKRAAWDRDLRRYLPGGVISQEHVGTPSVRHLP